MSVIELFDRALELDKADPDSDAALEAQNQAFDAAKRAGWDWEEWERGQFARWALRATTTEILNGARIIFKRWAKLIPCYETAQREANKNKVAIAIVNAPIENAEEDSPYGYCPVPAVRMLFANGTVVEVLQPSTK